MALIDEACKYGLPALKGKKLSATAYRVYLSLFERSVMKRKEWTSTVTFAELQQELDVDSPTTISTAIGALARHGLIAIHKPGNRARQYQIRLPLKEFEGDTSREEPETRRRKKPQRRIKTR